MKNRFKEDKILTILTIIDLKIEDFGKIEFTNKLKNVNIKELSEKVGIDEFTLKDIVEELMHPAKDIRENVNTPVLRNDILELKDLKPGMHLVGTVRNVTSFGAFIDIGMHDDGFVHISKMSHEFVKNPNDIVSAGDVVDCYVLEVLENKEKVALSLIKS